MSEDKKTQIFIGKLHPEVTERDLEYEFKRFGTLKEVSVKKGYAFISYETTEEAEKAIEKMNGETMSNQRIVVEFANAKKEHSSSRQGPFRGRDRRGGRDSFRRNSDYPSDRGDRKSSYGYPKPRGPQKDDVCYKCNKKGHWANECTERNNDDSPRREFRHRSGSYHGRNREESPRRRYDDDRNPRFRDRYRRSGSRSRSRSRSYEERRDSYRDRPSRYHEYGRNSRDERDERRNRDSRSSSYRNERRHSRSRSYDKKRRSEDKSRSRRYDDRRSKDYSEKNLENKNEAGNEPEKKELKKSEENRIASPERKEEAVPNDNWKGAEEENNNPADHW